VSFLFKYQEINKQLRVFSNGDKYEGELEDEKFQGKG
jgi:hypothetical protein